MSCFRRLLPALLALMAFALCLGMGPAAWCRRGAESWSRGDLVIQERLARTVARQTLTGLSTNDYSTGSTLFDGEWLFGTHLMAGIGFCQMIKQHPEAMAEWKPAVENCIRELLSKRVREFDSHSWRADALESLETGQGHAAYLGYMNFLLGLYREIQPDNVFNKWNDRITAALARRLAASPNGLIATYPGEWYPLDNAPVLASIALHGRATGKDYSDLLQKEEALLRRRYIAEKSGLLIQAVDAAGNTIDVGRGSGSALGAFFLQHAYPQCAENLFTAIKGQLECDFLGFGAIREYPHNESGRGDIDSGPVIFGYGFSATGFTIGAARAFGDDRLLAKLYSSAVLAGAPSTSGGTLDFLTAGPLGNAILFAMLTTTRQP